MLISLIFFQFVCFPVDILVFIVREIAHFCSTRWVSRMIEYIFHHNERPSIDMCKILSGLVGVVILM